MLRTTILEALITSAQLTNLITFLITIAAAFGIIDRVIKSWRDVQLARSNNEVKVKTLETEIEMIKERVVLLDHEFEKMDGEREYYKEMRVDIKELHHHLNEFIRDMLKNKIL